jgi:hypothetical protein
VVEVAESTRIGRRIGLVAIICIAAFLLAAVAPSLAAARADSTLVIKADSAGLHNLGGFHPLRNPTVGAAVAAFGRPSSRRPRYGGSGCDVAWRRIGLTMTFAYYGGGGGNRGACLANYGVAKVALIRGPRALRWQTNRGARIGDSREQLEQHHPSAVEWEGDYWLAIGRSIVGADDSYPILAALIDGGAVSGFEAMMSPGYD